MAGQRCLDKDAVEPGVGIQPGQQGQQIALAGRLRQNVGLGKDAQFGAGLLFPADIDFRGRVLPYAHECEAGLGASRLERGDLWGKLSLDVRRDGAAVNEVGQRHHSIT